eukprot:6214406-Pleurochrysis_carterae.AAC.7
MLDVHRRVAVHCALMGDLATQCRVLRSLLQRACAVRSFERTREEQARERNFARVRARACVRVRACACVRVRACACVRVRARTGVNGSERECARARPRVSARVRASKHDAHDVHRAPPRR